MAFTNGVLMAIALVQGSLADFASYSGAKQQRIRTTSNLGSVQDAVFPGFAPPSSKEISVTSFNSTVKSTGRWYVGHKAILPDPRRFQVQLGDVKCTAEQKTSITAVQRQCEYATNAGFFAYSGMDRCIGNLVIGGNGTVVQIPSADSGKVNFGTLSNGSFAIGFFPPASVQKIHFESLVQGVGWLVRDGKSYVNESSDIDPVSKFATEKAPRTSVGILPSGELLLLQVDGIESVKQGLDLFEFAEVLIDAGGAQHAINLDGGGSSVSVQGGKVISRPTCVDTPEPVCERAVTSITCIKPL